VESSKKMKNYFYLLTDKNVVAKKNNNVEYDGLLKQCERKSKIRDSDGILKYIAL